MKVLITIFPSHVHKTNYLGMGIAGALLLGGAIGSAVGGVGGVSNVVSNGLIFMDLQANMVGSGIKRHVIEHPIVGREGGVPQDLGSALSPVIIKGSWIYENEPEDGISELLKKLPRIPGIGWNWIRLEMMKALGRTGMPVMLASDLFVGPVLLTNFTYQEVGGKPNVLEYTLQYKELNPMLSLGLSAGFHILTTGAAVFVGGSTKGC